MPKNRTSNGFSLVELMVVITIIGVLSAIGMVIFSSAQAAARDARRKADLDDIKKAIYTLKTTKGKLTYSGTADNSLFPAAFSASASDATAGMNPTVAGNSMGWKLVKGGGFLKAPLHDPKCNSGTCDTGWDNYWLNVENDDKFTMYAKLETEPPAGTLIGCDPAAPPTPIPQSTYNYCITQ